MANSLDILLVDDEDHLQEVLGLLLELDGHKVTTAYSGEQALKIAAESQFDLVVTDLKMPGMSGLDIIKAFKETNPDIRVIMITGYPTEESEAEARRLGVDDYITKPFHMDRMREVLQQISTRPRNGEVK